jgi:serine/threonine protein kinase/class 3 adenylate cyclase
MIGRLVGGKYSLEREIGRGGMGSIWVALDTQLRRRVALKLMRPEMTSASSRGRFEREAMAVARIQNPHVIQIYDYGIDEEAQYIVMELLEGEDMEARIVRNPRLSIAAVATFVTQTAKALGAAHAAGIVHRDLKPANIFLARGEAEEMVKILDFGVAAMSSLGDDLHTTRTGTVLGTPHYMSPEQARSARTLDHRSDLWSLGVVAYRALTGQHPFTGESLGDLIVKICTDPFAPASELVPELGAEVDHFFERALAKDPAQRFQSARDLMRTFAGLVGDGREGRAAKILVIDDEPDLALLIKQRFRQQIRKSVYEFVFAQDGAAALEQLHLHPDIDLALSDINMPGMDGLTFLERASELRPLLEVVMVSAYGDMTNIRSAMNRGAFDFLVKPIDFKDFEVTITKTLKHVTDAQHTARSLEENAILRMFVSGVVLDRLPRRAMAGDVTASESVDVSVVFIDICGIDRLLASGSPEAAMRTLNANFEIIVPEVAARNGIVDKFLGDAVLAVFRGDKHAERALDASLSVRSQLARMAERAGEDSPYACGVTIGIDSGRVAMGSLGSRALSRLDLTVIGAAVSAAARLEAIAERGQILISERVFDAVPGAFECEPQKPVTLPGHEGPAAVFNIVGRIQAAEPSQISEARTVQMDESSVRFAAPGDADRIHEIQAALDGGSGNR